jgi:hypothetical protein
MEKKFPAGLGKMGLKQSTKGDRAPLLFLFSQPSLGSVPSNVISVTLGLRFFTGRAVDQEGDMGTPLSKALG